MPWAAALFLLLAAMPADNAGAVPISPERLRSLSGEFSAHLERNILGFWLAHGPDIESGGFYGHLDREGKPDPAAAKSLVLQSRIAWTFSAAYRLFPREEYRAAAERAVTFMKGHLWDRKYGGWFWSVSAAGEPLDNHKYLYGQSFAIYALAEHHRAFGDPESLDFAMKAFRLLEKHAHDRKNGGYFEPFTREWKQDLKVHPIGPPDKKSTNTHLHLLESFTALYLAGKDPVVRNRLEELHGIFLRNISDPSGYAHEYFDPDWKPLEGETSYGHEVEEAWLLLEAAEALGKPEDPSTRKLSLALVDRSLKFGYDHEAGGLFLRGPRDGPATIRTKTWWAQAEALVGFLAAYEISGDPRYFSQFDRLARWIFSEFADNEFGEWYQDMDAKGRIIETGKGSAWKGPYHNGRACMEAIRRLDRMAETAEGKNAD